MAPLQFVGVHLLLLARFGFAQNCKNMDFKVTVTTKALQNHVISNQPANDDGHCESKCFLHDHCISYNFGRDANGELGMCELNEADHVMYPEDLVPRDDTVYRMAENECRCSREQWCRPDFINYSFRCKCKPVQEKKYVPINCKAFSESNGEFFLDASDPNMTGYCFVTVNDSDCVEVKADPYRLTVDVYSRRTDSGPVFYPAFGFNVKDSRNFDFIYFRLHKTDNCIQPGYVKNGREVGQTSFCNHPPNPPPVNTWFTVTAEVSESTIKLFVDGKYVGQDIATALPLRPKGLLMVYNKYNNIAKFRNYSVLDL